MESNRNKLILHTSQAYELEDKLWWSKFTEFPRHTFKHEGFIISKYDWSKIIETFCPNAEYVSSDWRGAAELDGNLYPRDQIIYFTNNKVLSASKYAGVANINYMPQKDGNLKVRKIEISWTGELIHPQHLFDAINKVSEVRENTSIHMIVQDSRGLDLKPFKIEVPKLSINDNYLNWEDKHEYLLNRILNGDKKGICLLHGDPGTGKSMYIRYLISLISKEKHVIYIPNQLINALIDPTIIPLLVDYTNSVIVIEDADDALKSRDSGGATVNTILNLADGIMADFLGMQIICTFNTKITNIDKAILRKGRLILKHEFKALPKEQSQILLDKLDVEYKATESMTLADIYNTKMPFIEDDDKRTIGFGK